MPHSQSARYKTLWTGSLRAQDLIIEFDKGANSALYAKSDLKIISGDWHAREKSALAEGRTLYNSSIFRLAGHRELANGKLQLKLGLTSYREYVATRTPERIIARADPIGTSIILITSDGFMPLGRRATTAEVNPGKFFTFGGYFDADVDVTDGTPDLFGCICREVLEETGLEISASELTLNAIVYDLTSFHPEMSFIGKLNFSSAQVQASKWQSELDDLTMVKASDVLSFLDQHRAEFVPTMIGGIEACFARAVE